jgi:hypothetical protein
MSTAAGTIGTTVPGDGVADLAFFEIADDALSGVEPVRAATRQHDRVDALDHVQRIEQICLTSAGCGAALRNAADRTSAIDEDDRAPGRPFSKRVVTDLEPGDLGQPLFRRHLLHGRLDLG